MKAFFSRAILGAVLAAACFAVATYAHREAARLSELSFSFPDGDDNPYGSDPRDKLESPRGQAYGESADRWELGANLARFAGVACLGVGLFGGLVHAVIPWGQIAHALGERDERRNADVESPPERSVMRVVVRRAGRDEP